MIIRIVLRPKNAHTIEKKIKGLSRLMHLARAPTPQFTLYYKRRWQMAISYNILVLVAPRSFFLAPGCIREAR